jgi:cytochrome P450
MSTPYLATPPTLLQLTYTLLTIYLTYTLFWLFHTFYLHPLSHHPGVKLWIASPFLQWLSSMRGTTDATTLHHHTKLYPTHSVIRTGLNELSFKSAAAWPDIYGRKAADELPRYLVVADPRAPKSIITAGTEVHARHRKALAHGFSERALREQEGMIQGYVTLLVGRLREFAEEGRVVDMVQWYNLTTFDLIGELAFGRTFDCLKRGNLHEYMESLLTMLVTVPVIRGALQFPVIMWLLKNVFMTKRVTESRERQMAFARRCISERLARASTDARSPDFVESMMRNKDTPQEISEGEMVQNAMIILLAGSETSATLLSAATYYVLREPEKLARVTREVREAFASEDEIGFVSVTAKLPYMNACLDEALRIHPPVPSSLHRQTVRDHTMIAGTDVPKGTIVGVHQISTYHAQSNFSRPLEYLPERWLKENQKEGAEFASDKRDAFQPFSVGPRNCIGRTLANAEQRLIMARVLWNFDLTLVKPKEGWEKQKVFGIWIKQPLMVELKLRKRA